MNRLEIRAAGLMAAIIVGAVAMGANTFLRTEALPESHFSTERFAAAMTAAAAIHQDGVENSASSCQELEQAVAAWNTRLPAPWAMHHAGLESLNGSCARRARQLGQLLASDFRRMRLDVGPAVAVERADYRTPDPWRVVTGCIRNPGNPGWSASPPCAPTDLADSWLQNQLMPRAALLAQTPATQVAYRGKLVQRGADLTLTLDSHVQIAAEKIARCFTGGDGCDEILTPGMRTQPRFVPSNVRTGMLGMAVVDIATGRILALAGAISECTRINLQKPAVTVKEGNAVRLPAFRPGAAEYCPQVPDQRFAWLAETHPALWPVAPGSTMKPLAVLAGIVGGSIGDQADTRWRSILAESHDQDSPRQLALKHDGIYIRLLQNFGFDQKADLLLGGTAADAEVSWPMMLQSAGRLRQTGMNWETAQRIRKGKEAGVNTDAMYGKAVMLDYLAARQLMDTAIGGGNVRLAGALGLADIYRRIELRAQGYGRTPAAHLLEASHLPVPENALDFASTAQAARVTAMLSGVTAARLKGTAAGACRIVFGDCGPEGLPHLWGKTGTADASLAEESPYLNPGVIPAKIFGAVFQDAAGRRLAIAAVSLRSRHGRGALELQSNAAAEASLLMVRQLRQSIAEPAHP